MVLPLSLTILTTAFPAEKRGMIVGVYGGLAGLAVALGPIVGGALTEGIDWHWIFWVNVPIGLAAVALGTRLLPESQGAPERLDLAGVALAIASAVFSAHGRVGGPATVTAGFRPALWTCAAFAVLAALTALGISPRRAAGAASVEAVDLPVAA